MDGFLNFKKVNNSKFCQEFNRVIKLVDFQAIVFLGGHIWLNCGGERGLEVVAKREPCVPSELTFEPVDGFLNFKKVNESKFCQ